MPITYTITHQRPSTDVEWTEITPEFQERIDHFLGTGDLTSFTIVNHDELNSTTTIVMPDITSEQDVINDDVWVSFAQGIQSNYDAAGIVINETRSES